MVQRLFDRRILCGAVLSVSLLPAVARAGGIMLYEVGSSADVGAASAGYAARAQDPATTFTNPAGLTLVPGTQVMLGVQPMYGQFKVSVDEGTQGGGNSDNAVGFVPAGSTFASYQVDDRLTIGFGIFSYFGLSEDFGDHWAGRYYIQNATLAGLTFMPSAGYKVTDNLSVGAGLNAMAAKLRTQVAVNNIEPGRSDGQLSLADEKWGFGADVGVLYQFSKGTRVGLTYLSPVDLNFSPTTSFYNLGPGLSALSSRFHSVDLGVTVPQTVMLSAYHELNDQWALMGNVGWQNWSEFGQVDVSIDSTNPRDLTTDLNYDDTWHVALGAQYKPVQNWMLTGGVAYDSSMVSDSDRSFTVPVAEAWRFGIGTQYEVSKSLSLGLAYELVYSGDISISQSRGPLAGTVSGTMDNAMMHVVAFTLIWKM